MALNVLCPSCGISYMETNDADGVLPGGVPSSMVKKYDPDRPTNGAMLKLKDKYASYGWSCFTHDVSTIFDALECPGCGGPLAGLSGKVKTRPQNGDEPLPVVNEEYEEQEDPEIVEQLKVPETLAESPEAAHIGEPDVPYSEVAPEPVNKTPVDRLTQFLTARPGDPWEGAECGCEKLRADYSAEIDTCDECRAERDKMATRIRTPKREAK